MTAPICGARTWVTPDEMVTCDRPAGHDADPKRIGVLLDPESAHACGLHTWRDPKHAVSAVERFKGRGEGYADRPVRLMIHGAPLAFTPTEARNIRDLIQEQLDALDPDAAIAEAERRMLDAFDRRVRLVRISDLYGEPLDVIEAAAEEAKRAQREAFDAWASLVEARDAKGGGA